MIVRLLTLVVVASALGAAVHGPARRWNVVVIGIDTLRADHLGYHGYPRPTSPHIDRLSKGSVFFTTAVSSSPWTLPAFASMFTGLLPSRHRAGEGSGFERTRLDEHHSTLATHLRRAGYSTASFVSNGFVGTGYGLAEGIDESQTFLTGAEAQEAALAWLRAHARERFFMFVHLVEPHQPYEPPAEDAAPFLDPSYTGRIGLAFGGFRNRNLSPPDLQRVIDLYDGEVRYADRLVGELVDSLAALGLLEQTIVVVTADHGEELSDHGLFGHGHNLFDELLRVPLLIRFPGAHPRGSVRSQVSVVDLTPTLLDAVGVPVPGGLDGISLMPLLVGPFRSPPRQAAFAEYMFMGPELKAIRLPAEKLVFNPRTRSSLFYILTLDPHEQHSLSPGIAKVRMRELVAQISERLLVPVGGFQAMVRWGWSGKHLRLVLAATQPLVGAELVEAEPDDRVTLSRDRTTLTLDLHRRPTTMPAVNESNVDLDGVHFRTTEHAPITIASVELDGEPVAPGCLRIGGDFGPVSGLPPLTLLPNSPGLEAATPAFPPPRRANPLDIAFQFVKDPAPVRVIDESVRANLRALGYVD